MEKVCENKKSKGIYDDIAYTYKVMDDAPYRLDAKELRSMQKMERALNFILNNLDKQGLSLIDVAEEAGYRPGYFDRSFRDYFNMPFSRFVSKLRIRQAARDIRDDNYPDQVGRKYGFSSVQSFSKAFKREFGISPRGFYKGAYEVPDMPSRGEVKGLSIELEYRQVNAFTMSGIELPPPNGDDTYLMDATAFIFGADLDRSLYTEADFDLEEEKVGIWWYEKESSMEYVFGPVIKDYDTPYVPQEPGTTKSGESEKVITVLGGNYAVFSYKTPEDHSLIRLYSRILSRFIFKEWVPINKKVTDTMGFTYEVFGKERVSIYVPIRQGMGLDDILRRRKWGIQEWASYIDEHITDDISLESLAIIAGYSPQNYRDIFCMYFGITPSLYIRKRRLYLAKYELASGESQSEVMEKYRFPSLSSFRKMYMKEFGSDWDSMTQNRNGPDIITDKADKNTESEVRLDDLEDYYKDNKGSVKVSFKNRNMINVISHSIEESESDLVPRDILGRLEYWFDRDFEDFKHIKRFFARPEEKLFVWGEDPEIEGDQRIYKYYVGSVLHSDVNIKDRDIIIDDSSGTHYDQTELPSGAYLETIPGGRYAVFSSFKENDRDAPSETFMLLTRYAFGGWINENRWRVDMKRRTFVIWTKGKLLFYVPIIR